jgi:hypothetical protein
MEGIYEEMIARNAREIDEKGYLFDDKLRGDDTRRCFAIFSDNMTFNLEPSYYNIIDDFSEHCCYTPPPSSDATLHFTLFQVIPFAEFDGAPQSLDYLSVIRQIPIEPFTITYRHLIPTRNGILMAGYPSIDVNELRDRIRKKFAEEGLPLREPYHQNIVHSTVVRYTSVPKKTITPQTSFFGTGHVSAFKIGVVGWKVIDSEIDAVTI